MSLETEIREAFERHATEARPQTEAWKGIERRIERSHKLRLIAVATGTAAAIVTAVLVTPGVFSQVDRPVVPGPVSTAGWKTFENPDGGYVFRYPPTWTALHADHSSLVVVQPDDVARDGGKPLFSLDLVVNPGDYDDPAFQQKSPNFVVSRGVIGGRHPYVRIESRLPGANVSVRYHIDWTKLGCPPGPPCPASPSILVANLSAATPGVWDRYGDIAQQIVSTIRAVSLAPSPASTAIVDPKLQVIKTLRGTKTELFTGEPAVDPGRNLLLIGEQHDEGLFEFRVRVVDASTLKTVRYLGPGILHALDPSRGFVYLYVGIGTANMSLDVFDIETGQEIASLPADEGITPPALDLAHGLVYVSRYRARSIEVYDVLAGFKLVRALPVDQSIRWMAIDQRGETLFVSWDRVGVSLLDAVDGQVLRTITGFDNPTRSAPRLTAGDGWFTADVGNYQGSELGMYTSQGALSWEVHLGRGVARPVVDRNQGLLFNAVNDLTDGDFAAPNDAPDLVEVRSFATGKTLGSIRVPVGPVALAIDTGRRQVYVACLDNSVVVLSY